MSLVVKAALWASGREPRALFTRFHLPQREDGETKFSVTLKNRGAPQRTDLTLAVRTDRDMHVLPKAPWAQPGVGRSEAVLRPIHFETRSLRLTEGEQTFGFALPPLPRGDYFVDVRASADGKNINWVTVPWLVPSDSLIAGISFMPEAVNLAGNTGTLAQVVLSRPATAGTLLEAVLVDNHHRILRRQEVALNEGTRAVELAFDVAGAKTTLLKLRAAIHVNGRALDLKTECFTVYNRPWPTFTYFAWGCGNAGSSLSRQMHRLAAFHGMDASFSGVGKNTLRVADLRSVGGVAAHHGKVEPGGTIANPCVTSPAYRAGLRNGIRQRAKSRKMSDCFGYTTGDETTYASGLFAGCGSETCTAHLRSSMKKQYGTIDALNRQWDTNHRSFTEIQPIDDPEAYRKRSLKTGNFSARIDQWLANYDAYMDWFRYLDDALEHYAPRARFGFMTNCFYGHDRGYDFPGMMKSCDFASPYGPGGWPPYFDCVQNFGSSDLIFGGHTVTRGLDRFSEDSWKIPFWILLRGGRNAWYYLFTIGGEGAVSPYLDLYPCLDAYSKAVRAVKKGPADLLLGAKRKVDPIAVYYSTPSLIFSSAVSGPKCIIALKPFNRQLRYLGLQGQIIHRGQLLSGALKKRGIRVLGLPMIQCVSDQEAALLREFVLAGGLLIADYRPGIADEHGRLFAQEELPKLFGLRWEKDVLLPEGKSMLRIKDGLDRSLRLDGAAARSEKDGVPVLTVNKLGKGMAVCLNTPLTTRIYHELLAEHGITSDVKFEGRKGTKHTGAGLPGAEVNRLTDGEAQYYGITCNRDLKQATIQLKKRGHLYDMLKGEYLGDKDRIEAKDFARLVRVFSFLPYRVAALKLECGKEAHPGNMIRGTVKVESGGATPVRHVIHIAAHRPDGKTVRYLAQNLETENGSVTFSIPLALNEPTGQWKLSARDVATGVAADSLVMVLPSSDDEDSPECRFQARQARGIEDWSEKPPKLAELVKEYNSATLHRRIDIVNDLGAKGDVHVRLGVLKQAVQDPDPVLRWSSVKALGSLGISASPAAPALAESLRNSEGIRKDILKAFRQIGRVAISEALPAIAEGLGSANPRVRFETLRTIAEAKTSRDVAVRDAVIRCFENYHKDHLDLDVNILAAYLDALAIFSPSEKALPIYTRAVAGFPMHIRLNEQERKTVGHGELVRKLARFTYYEHALQRLHKNNFSYRLMAVEALKALGDQAEGAIPSVVRALENTVKKRSNLSGHTRIQIWLNRAPNPSPPADESFRVAKAMCQFLAMHGEKAKAAIPFLNALKNLDPGLAQAAQEAMRKIDPDADARFELEGGADAPESNDAPPDPR
ncbi:MAG: beta-galactosidase trimerization domain-containing protein [Planctomycetota bacterium]|nr:beta-galactosidase trimerization domain-containing protein [Planctomycetota bacterium]